ncbi:MAG TPA: hypothetical protein VNU93_06850 [Verrucomicrobiae bacterium]|nr:hypothetical protein [Verrucomicrobiae bacterium]
MKKERVFLRVGLILLCLGQIFLLTACLKVDLGLDKDELTKPRVKELVNAAIKGVEYQAYVPIGQHIGATAEDPEKFLKQLGIVDYVIRQDAYHTWFVISSLTAKGKKLLKPVSTPWGTRYACTIAKLELAQVDSITLNSDGVTAVAQVMLRVKPTDAELAKYLSPEKSVFNNHNIHIELVNVAGNANFPWGVPKGNPYKLQFKKQANGWQLEKLLTR